MFCSVKRQLGVACFQSNKGHSYQGFALIGLKQKGSLVLGFGEFKVPRGQCCVAGTGSKNRLRRRLPSLHPGPTRGRRIAELKLR